MSSAFSRDYLKRIASIWSWFARSIHTQGLGMPRQIAIGFFPLFHADTSDVERFAQYFPLGAHV